MSPTARTDMEQRFRSLRRYGRLPQGRENRNRRLSEQQVASAILGLGITAPGWAGHAAAVLERRFPVGGNTNAFARATTLHDALVAILTDKVIRDSLVTVRISSAERGENSQGFATVIFTANGVRRSTHYVPAEAVSLLQPGMDAQFDPDQRYASASRELVLNKYFFDRVAAQVEQDRWFPRTLPAESPEYDEEEAERARRARLGATPSSQFLNVGVDNHVTWPREEVLVQFDQYKLVLMPKTPESVQSIHIDLHANRLSMEGAMTLINRFLSLLTWCDDQFAVAQGGWSGNPVPVAVPKRNLAFSTTSHWLFNRQIPTSEDVRRALALYREARNAEQNYMISYAVLSYFKVLEVRYREGKDIKPWIARVFPVLANDRHNDIFDMILKSRGEEPIEQYLWSACRVAVAHVREKHPSDPDEAGELRRLHHAADAMRLLARHFIREELGVSDSPIERLGTPQE